MTITFTFPGEPRAVQSVRFAKIGNFMRKYQPKTVTEWKSWIKLQAVDQISRNCPGFKPFSGPLGVDVDFVFTLPKSACKADRMAVSNGLTVYKDTRPDLGDNLCKGTFDALTEIVWLDDSQIVEIHSRKVYGLRPMIAIKVTEKQMEGGLFK